MLESWNISTDLPHPLARLWRDRRDEHMVDGGSLKISITNWITSHPTFEKNLWNFPPTPLPTTIPLLSGGFDWFVVGDCNICWGSPVNPLQLQWYCGFRSPKSPKKRTRHREVLFEGKEWKRNHVVLGSHFVCGIDDDDDDDDDDVYVYVDSFSMAFFQWRVFVVWENRVRKKRRTFCMKEWGSGSGLSQMDLIYIPRLHEIWHFSNLPLPSKKLASYTWAANYSSEQNFASSAVVYKYPTKCFLSPLHWICPWTVSPVL